MEVQGTAEFPQGMLTDCSVSWQAENRYANGVTPVHMDDATSKRHPFQTNRDGYGVLFLGSEGWVHVDRSSMDAEPKSLLQLTPGPKDIRLFKTITTATSSKPSKVGRRWPRPFTMRCARRRCANSS